MTKYLICFCCYALFQLLGYGLFAQACGMDSIVKKRLLIDGGSIYIDKVIPQKSKHTIVLGWYSASASADINHPSDTSFVCLLNSQNNVLWSKYFVTNQDSSMGICDAIETTNAQIVLYGLCEHLDEDTAKPPSQLLVKFDSFGKLLAANAFSFDTDTFTHAENQYIQETDNGGICVANFLYRRLINDSTFIQQVWLTCFDKNNQLVWSKSLFDTLDFFTPLALYCLHDTIYMQGRFYNKSNTSCSSKSWFGLSLFAINAKNGQLINQKSYCDLTADNHIFGYPDDGFDPFVPTALGYYNGYFRSVYGYPNGYGIKGAIITFDRSLNIVESKGINIAGGNQTLVNNVSINSNATVTAGLVNYTSKEYYLVVIDYTVN